MRLPAISRSTLVGAGFMLASGLVVSFMEAAVRGVSQTLHPFILVFWRELFSVALLLPLWSLAGRPRVARARLPLHALRALLNGGAILTWYLALRSLPLAEATALGFTAILFAAMGSRAVLGERVFPLQWIAIAVGLGGALLVIGPQVALELVGGQAFALGDARSFGAAAALGSAVLFAASMLVAKLQSRGDGSAVSALLLAIGMGALAGLLAVPLWTWPSASDFAWLGFFAVCNVFGQVFFLEAMRRASAAVVIPLDVFRLVWALVFGVAIYAEWPTPPALIGAMLIAGSAILVVFGARRGVDTATEPARQVEAR
ncbi:drug/metabolite transporter (DMT)-like permease [Angulomicrobium tetraedrale]|uniref:Drug/metabolite transporter (DMT)-like permease n=1 Tax=Ancylobacter tetraedralis TaxID=217068 RepID=A0A839Z6I5_9HYPH|nr:DMT family transporter [Ancylobacter tetraedralis]MBB3769585.1 drug/metabolite transporter (DMT)-like permease [Ancylobacter tetraedralis]